MKTTTAQPFVSATTGDNSAGLGSISANNTGNDILNVGSDLYKVSVWSEAAGSTPGMAWRVTGTNTNSGYLIFNTTTDIIHADVCLLYDGTDVWAIAAWYYNGVSGKSWNFEAYKWTTSGTNGTFSYQNGGFVTGSWGTTLNIDGDENGNFAAVFDDNSQNMYAVTGTVISGFSILNLGNAVAISPYNAINGIYPDVCLYSNSSPTEEVLISYIDDNGTLNIDKHTFYDLTINTGSNSTSLLNNLAPPNSMTFTNCRIACPNSTGASGEWTVVVMESNHSSQWFIEGYNNNSTTTPIYYNTGAYFANGNIRAIPNFEPVVAYSSTYPSNNCIWVGWQVSDIGSSNAYVPDALFSIVMACDYTAVPPGATAAYWIVPYTLSNGDVISCLSLSGRYATDKLFCTYWNVNSNGAVYTKEATPSTATSLRTEDNQFVSNIFPSLNNILNSFAGKPFMVEIYNLNGQLIFKEKVFSQQAFDTISFNKMLLNSSMYLARFISDDGSIKVTRKFSVNF